MRLGVMSKQPDETRRVSFVYTKALTENDILESATLKGIAPDGVTITLPELSAERTMLYFLVSGGVSGTRYTITLSVTTLLGEVFEDELLVRVREVS